MRKPWEVYLNEIACHPDPQPICASTPLGIWADATLQAEQDLLDMGFIQPVGFRMAGPVEQRELLPIYALTTKGRKHWTQMVEAGFIRPAAAKRELPFPSWKHYVGALVRLPLTVFELAEIPWNWDRLKEWEEANRSNAKREGPPGPSPRMVHRETLLRQYLDPWTNAFKEKLSTRDKCWMAPYGDVDAMHLGPA